MSAIYSRRNSRWLRADWWLPLDSAVEIISRSQGFVACSTGAPIGRSRSRYPPAGCCVRLAIWCCKFEGPRVAVTKDSQDVVAARRVAASRINLPSRSFRTVGLGRVFCRLAARGGVVAGGVSSGGRGFGGLAGSSAWGCRWPTRHKALSKKV